MAKPIPRDAMIEELNSLCVEIAQNIMSPDGDEFLAARERARYSIELLVKYCGELEPKMELLAIEGINSELFLFYGDPNNGECDYSIQSWDDLYQRHS